MNATAQKDSGPDSLANCDKNKVPLSLRGPMMEIHPGRLGWCRYRLRPGTWKTIRRQHRPEGTSFQFCNALRAITVPLSTFTIAGTPTVNVASWAPISFLARSNFRTSLPICLPDPG